MCCLDSLTGPPSPPRVSVKAIYAKGTVVYATLNWTCPDHDGNSPITAYEPGCKRKDRFNFHVSKVDSSVYSAEVLCARSYRSTRIMPYLLHFVLRVVARNLVDSTSSELIGLTVEIRPTVSNRSELEVVVLPPTSFTTTTSKPTCGNHTHTHTHKRMT